MLVFSNSSSILKLCRSLYLAISASMLSALRPVAPADSSIAACTFSNPATSTSISSTTASVMFARLNTTSFKASNCARASSVSHIAICSSNFSMISVFIVPSSSPIATSRSSVLVASSGNSSTKANRAESSISPLRTFSSASCSVFTLLTWSSIAVSKMLVSNSISRASFITLLTSSPTSSSLSISAIIFALILSISIIKPPSSPGFSIPAASSPN